VNESNTKELRFKSSSIIIGYLRKFSATEKVVFSVLSVVLVISAITLAIRANSYFMTEIPAHGGLLREGLIGLPHNVNPVLALTDIDRDIVSLVYSGLMKYEGGKLVPDLAESYSVSEDGLTYTFRLRDNIKFHNGATLTSEDVVFTIEKIKNYILKSPRASEWNGISASSTDTLTVTFQLKQSHNAFLHNTTIGIISKKIWGNVNDEQFIFSEYNMKPIGSGPYKIVGTTRDQGGIPTSYRLEAWNGYHGKKPWITGMQLNFYPDLEHAINALTIGSIDSLAGIPPSVAERLVSNKGEPYTVISSPLTRAFGIFFNQNKNSLLADSTVRRALDMALDRNALIQEVLVGYGLPMNSPFPAGFELSTTTRMAVASTTGAQNLLMKSGWKLNKDGIFEKKPSKNAASTTLSFTVHTVENGELRQVAEFIKNSWQKAGISVTIKILPATDLYQTVIRTREYDALLFGEAIGKTGDLYSFWHSSQRNAPGLNISLYTNSRVDKWLENARHATSSELVTSSYTSFYGVFMDELPAIFIYSPDFIYAIPKNLQGVKMPIVTSQSDRFENVDDWYIKTEKVWNFLAPKQ